MQVEREASAKRAREGRATEHDRKHEKMWEERRKWTEEWDRRDDELRRQRLRLDARFEQTLALLHRIANIEPLNDA